MALRFFNTYSRQLEEFAPRHPASPSAQGESVGAASQIDIYTCGPTVYSRAHIGNFRAYIFEDLLQRHLEVRGYKVHRVMNLTDVDDKTIRGAREAKVPLTSFTEPFKQAFFEDLETLRIKRADEFPAATEQRYIDRMIAMIGTLVSRDLAYQAEDKSVYFRINKFPDYGRLAHFDLTQLQATGRVKHDEYDKEHIGDFALWKAWDEEDGEVKWDSPWGPGRPGWHIECSAMATALLGDEIDIHCGGVDNIFPHHEAEIAQSEGATGKKFVRYWLHCAHLLVDGQKMSKSLGNFYTLPDVLAKGYTGREIRYALMRVHYRVPLNFTWQGMEEARESLVRIDEWLARLRGVEGNVQPASAASASRTDSSGGEDEVRRGQRPTPKAFGSRQPNAQCSIEEYGFEKAMDDDLNISAALGVLFETIRETNRAMDREELDGTSATAWLKWWQRIDTVLDVEAETEIKPPAEVLQLAKERETARREKNWKRSDQLRDQILALGWETRDTKDGQKLARCGGSG
jgi:cysteinyl-tRNA synthetase